MYGAHVVRPLSGTTKTGHALSGCATLQLCAPYVYVGDVRSYEFTVCGGCAHAQGTAGQPFPHIRRSGRAAPTESRTQDDQRTAVPSTQQCTAGRLYTSEVQGSGDSGRFNAAL